MINSYSIINYGDLAWASMQPCLYGMACGLVADLVVSQISKIYFIKLQEHINFEILGKSTISKTQMIAIEKRSNSHGNFVGSSCVIIGIAGTVLAGSISTWYAIK